jgi:hypothetical protein
MYHIKRDADNITAEKSLQRLTLIMKRTALPTGGGITHRNEAWENCSGAT